MDLGRVRRAAVPMLTDGSILLIHNYVDTHPCVVEHGGHGARRGTLHFGRVERHRIAILVIVIVITAPGLFPFSVVNEIVADDRSGMNWVGYPCVDI